MDLVTTNKGPVIFTAISTSLSVLCGSSNMPYQLPEREENQVAKNVNDTAISVK